MDDLIWADTQQVIFCIDMVCLCVPVIHSGRRFLSMTYACVAWLVLPAKGISRLSFMQGPAIGLH